MAFDLANRLIRVGVPYPLASELSRQITSGTANPLRLIYLGVPYPLASEIGSQIEAGEGQAQNLMALGMPSVLAKEVASQIGDASGGGGSSVPPAVTFGNGEITVTSFGTVPAPAVTFGASRMTVTTSTAPRSLVGWGDSLTEATQVVMALRWPNLVGATDPVRTVLNRGIGGQTSTQIRDRCLANESMRDWLAVIWAGRNNAGAITTVQADVAAMVAHNTSGQYLVGGVTVSSISTSGGGDSAWLLGQVATLNAALQATYGERFVDMQAALVAAGDPLDAADAADIAQNRTPWSVTTDGLHLNAAGNAAIAAAVNAKIAALGW